LPKVRETDESTLVIANGFSCRKQIELTTDRRALHLAHVLRMAANETQRPGGTRELQSKPELALLPPEPKAPTKAQSLLVIGAGVAVVGALTWWLVRRRR